MNLKQLGQQAWRVARLFVVSFVAQWQLLPANHQFARTALISAAIAAVEAVYRQMSPQGEASILGWLSGLLDHLTAVAKDRRPAAKAVEQNHGSDAIVIAEHAVQSAEAEVLAAQGKH